LVEKRQCFIPLIFNLHDFLEPSRISAQNFHTNCPCRWAVRRCKILPKSSTTWAGRTNVTDDRQTDALLHKANVVRLKSI